MINSTHVKAHRSAAGGRGGSTSRLLAARAEGATRRCTHSQMLKGRPVALLASASACTFVLRPPRERPTACLCSPSSPRRRTMRFDVSGVDHLRVPRSTISGQLPEQFFPYAAPRPPSEAIIDRRLRPVGFGTIGPAAAAFQRVYDTADNAAIVLPLDTAYISRQVRFDPLPLLVAQPKQIPAHDPNPSPKEKIALRYRKKLMSSHPNFPLNDEKREPPLVDMSSEPIRKLT